ALSRSLGALTGRRTIDDEAWDSIEEALLVADVGVATTSRLVGVNGTGKTTTIAKLAQREIEDGHAALMAAADPFRAAAADQLTHWAERVGADVVRGQEGADPGSVVFDAVDAAGGRGAGVVLVDTAGRMHPKGNPMEGP